MLKYLLDTNVVIQFLDGSIPSAGMKFVSKVIDVQCNISSITKMEVLGFNFNSASEETTMESFINGSIVLDINNDVTNRTIIIRKGKKIGLPDAIIAATAIVYNLTLITRNNDDFKNINGLIV